MSAKGQKQTWRHVRVMSVIPLKADIRRRVQRVCFVPQAEVRATCWSSEGYKCKRKALGRNSGEGV